MSRWHRPDCPAPAIVPAADGTPSCRACARTPDLDALIRQQAHASPFPAPPADQPRGQMNLWWPRSVPYVDVTAGGLDKDPSQQGSAPPPPEHPPPLPSQSTPAESTTTPAKNEQRSPIYPRPLAQGEFRLACLTPPTPVTSDADSASESDAASNPVHLTLETYPLTNCPAYETVSYCWAGEDADSMRRWPVYVGPWWDVMLHTRNCWELLRFVRPARGFRLMWVDAVCIDQSCDEERTAQVAQMGRIYNLCTQVVVYLGPDLASVLPPGKHPRRARLQDLETEECTGAENLGGVKTLMQRRYFSRLWVVQELILAPRVVIRMRDVEFHSDGATSGKLWAGEPTERAPWVRHASRGAPLALSLRETMQLTFSMACADPRDRLFGVLGIVSPEWQRLDPDYSLSSQQVFTGLFAHLLITEGRRHLLHLGCGVSSPSCVPSWVPDWTSWESWRRVFDLPPPANTTDFEIFRSSEAEVLRHSPPNSDHSLTTVRLPLRYRQAVSDLPFTGLAVDHQTGALTGKLISLVRFGSVPKLVAQLRGTDWPSTLFEARCGEHTMFLASRHRLDLIVQPQSDHIYLFALEDNVPLPGICILRSDDTGTHQNICTFVATCDVVLFRFMHHVSRDSSDPAERSSDVGDLTVSLYAPRRHPWPAMSSLDDAMLQSYLYNGPCVGDIHWTVAEIMEVARAWLDVPLSAAERLIFLPSDGWTRRKLLPLYWSAIDGHGGFHFWLSAYTKFVEAQRWKVRIADSGRTIFTIPRDVWGTLYDEYSPKGTGTSNIWEAAVPDPYLRLALASASGHGSRIQPSSTVEVAISWHIIQETIMKSNKPQLLSIVREAARRAQEPREVLLSREPTERDTQIRVPTGQYAERLMEECGCDGSLNDVIII